MYFCLCKNHAGVLELCTCVSVRLFFRSVLPACSSVLPVCSPILFVCFSCMFSHPVRLFFVSVLRDCSSVLPACSPSLSVCFSCLFSQPVGQFFLSVLPASSYITGVRDFPLHPERLWRWTPRTTNDTTGSSSVWYPASTF